jgi:mannose-6-phosphate isomerase-like protein (cupin superfamily)
VKVRRVVTGQVDGGKSVFVSDEEVEPVTLAISPGAEYHRLWASDEIPQLPTDGSGPSQSNFFPPAGGFRWLLFTVPPAGSGPPEGLDIEAAVREMEEKLPGAAGHMERDNPGMHTTDTVDFEVVLSGEIWLELDDGAEVHLKAGDTVVQNGTRHRWSNKGTEPAVIAAGLIGANRS